MNPQETRIKATAAMLLTASLFLVRGAHATVHAGLGCTFTGTPGARPDPRDAGARRALWAGRG